ncbi:hypothetical protein B0T24DRAFT_632561 [Lasiosphaeria ovina]|uniref:EKC/KEOPS complex subunit BUD32 n=1 Tax=Lasiosphaeria ovina TaxID=92902 RepID=A0AAE0K3S2_9PEZI|nr:hypothetical protein B0T24DRAFT_632561 [Lasiosphaeria ovina]
MPYTNEEELGFDPIIITANDKRFIEIERDSLIERLIINEQYPERDKEGELLYEATNQGVINRSCSASPTKAGGDALSNRVYRRIILRNYGKPIYKASSRSALLTALEGYIEGHKSLRRKAGLLHRDISINNLIINEDDDNLSWPSFLIDLDLAVKEQREGTSGVKGKTGTRAFMAIGVLFWICIHYTRPDKSRPIIEFDKWNYIDTEELAKLKLGTMAKESLFIKTITDNFTPYYEPLIPLLNRLRKIDEKLYSRMREILWKDWKDLE